MRGIFRVSVRHFSEFPYRRNVVNTPSRQIRVKFRVCCCFGFWKLDLKGFAVSQFNELIIINSVGIIIIIM